ncbi:TetR/AcrR family transcriptional regulator [Fructilactobacillus sp. Tb1]|uniref:TetR/AcrR family transcriptional regulator n=1 Tax=Fructilactobacillus sp. Tb1 TaxID=3422304 RepID=UPI003D2D6809
MNNNIENVFKNSITETNLSEKQQAVLKASLELFSQKGFENTNTKDIAQRAGVSEGTVYREFKTKQGILDAILTPFNNLVIPKLANEFFDDISQHDNENFESFLNYFINNRMHFAIENRDQIRIFLQEFLHSESLLAAFKNEVEANITMGLIPILKKYQDNGQIKVMPVQTIVQIILSTTLGYMIPCIVTKKQVSTTDLNEWSKQATSLILNGIA